MQEAGSVGVLDGDDVIAVAAVTAGGGVVAVEHADRAGLLHRHRDALELRLDRARQLRRMHVGLAQAHHLGAEREMALVLARIAQVHQRQQAAAHRRAAEPGAQRDLADRQPRAVLVEGLDDAQALFQTAQQVALGDVGGLGQRRKVGGGGVHRDLMSVKVRKCRQAADDPCDMRTLQ